MKDRLQEGPSADDVRKWVVAVALGKLALVDCGFGLVDRLPFKIALGRAHDMWFTQEFASRHPELAKITSAIAAGDGSKWRVRAAAPRRGGPRAA